jgi:predicted negative regulator of RcsB-dependent stress response
MIVFKQYEEEAKLVLAVILVIILAYLGYVVWSWHNAAQVNEATVTQDAATQHATSAITTDLSHAQQETQRVEVVVKQARDNYAVQYQKALDSDAAAAAFAAAPIPDSLRDAARARRCARDGLGSSETGCTVDDKRASSSR